MLDENELEELAQKVDGLRGLGRMSDSKALSTIIKNIPQLSLKEREDARDQLSTYLLGRPMKNILNFPTARTGRDRGAESIIITTDPSGRKMAVGTHRRTSGIERSLPKGDRD